MPDNDVDEQAFTYGVIQARNGIRAMDSDAVARLTNWVNHAYDHLVADGVPPIGAANILVAHVNQQLIFRLLAPSDYPDGATDVSGER